MEAWTIGSLLELIKHPRTVNYDPSLVVTSIRPIDDAAPGSLAFISAAKSDKESLARHTAAAVVICDPELEGIAPGLAPKCFIIVEKPQAVFADVVRRMMRQRAPTGIHPSAVVDPKAVISESAFIGPHCTIGECSIGRDTRIMGNVYIGDGVTIGDNVTIFAGAVIGADGFGYYKDEHGEICNFPHIGGVVIEDWVEIGANACVDRGGLSATRIARGAKIDNLVHIAHNVVVGENAFVIAHSMVGGSTRIGQGAWIAPSATIIDQCSVGNGAFVGLGSVVTKPVPDGEVWAGAPARRLKERAPADND